jgi:hypothetical protein
LKYGGNNYKALKESKMAADNSNSGLAGLLTGGEPFEMVQTIEVPTQTLVKLAVFFAVVFILWRIIVRGGSNSPPI